MFSIGHPNIAENRRECQFSVQCLTVPQLISSITQRSLHSYPPNSRFSQPHALVTAGLQLPRTHSFKPPSLL